MALKKRRTPAKVKKGESYKCGVCGYGIVVDAACGCAEEHVFVCCGRPMKKSQAKKAAPKKSSALKSAPKRKSKKQRP